MEIKHVLAISFAVILLFSLSFVIAEDSEENETEVNVPINYGQCVKLAAEEKNICYAEFKSAYQGCRQLIKNNTELTNKEKRNALKNCTIIRKDAKKNCMSAFKLAKEECLDAKKPKENITETKQCISNATEAKKLNYENAKAGYNLCKENAKDLKGKDKNSALKICGNEYAQAKKGFLAEFKLSKENCKEPEETESEEIIE